MARGFGVSVVIETLARGLAARGVAVTIGCVEQDGTIQGLDIRPVKPQPDAIAALAQAVGATVLVAHTSPFFEALPALQGAFSCWAWEHGDPSPAFFDSDRAAREAVVRHKQERVYPALTGVVAISEFIAHDIGWPQAHLIFNGCDHVPDRGSKGLQDYPLGDGAPLKIGTLMRIGQGEARYKGLQVFLDLATAVRASGLHADMHIMGRGTPEDAKPFQAAGIHTHLNATDEERAAYLRGLDVFISPSLWEGCNLPLLEAQALGTAGLAYDTGAHPEMTPLLAANARDMLSLVQAYAQDRGLLRRHSLMCYHFVRRRYRWSSAVDDTVRLFGLTAGTQPMPLGGPLPVPRRGWLGVHAKKLLWSLRAEGVFGAARRTKAYLSYHLHKDRSG
ncbi:glycosyltransferase family 4 protein [Azospirillum sp. A1-3]|uniref:glycosyltransferase family 4 protein n=1 Tax=Azospirillum sp. A1-3 TaxID=185874 RepID=UPI002077306B|nr:glycosyltransferase family 4 protein [Azospirillum sp. A1-3]MCM8738689.1 glycosyltransferase family 4 protein [Azospirillum sp. A1-3]